MAMTLLMEHFCVVKQGHRFTVEQSKVGQEQQITSTSIQHHSKTRQSDSGRALIRLVPMVLLLFSLNGSLNLPLPKLLQMMLFQLSALSHIKTHEKSEEAFMHFHLVSWNWTFEKAKIDNLRTDNT